MSTPHTDNETMEDETKHTPAPWHRPGLPWHNDRTTIWSESDPNAGKLIACNDHAAFSPELYEEGEVEANMRRICAAVNATEGISTTALEHGVVAELVEALERMTERVEATCLELDATDCAHVADELVGLLPDTWSVLAKVRPETQEENQ